MTTFPSTYRPTKKQQTKWTAIIEADEVEMKGAFASIFLGGSSE